MGYEDGFVLGPPVGGPEDQGLFAEAPALPLTTAPECENDRGGRFTLWSASGAQLPSCLSCGAATSCGPIARSSVARERLGPWRERPPSPRAWYGFGTRWKFAPRPCPPGVAPAPTIPGGKAVRTPLRDAADQPDPPAAAAVAKTARAALLPAPARGVADSSHPRRPWPRHRDPRLPLRSGPRPGFTSRPRRPPVRGGRPACRESGCPRRARPPAFLQRTAGSVATRRGGLGGSAHPNLRRCHNGHRKRSLRARPPCPARHRRPGGRGATASRTTTCAIPVVHVRTGISRTSTTVSHVRLHPVTDRIHSGPGSTSRVDSEHRLKTANQS